MPINPTNIPVEIQNLQQWILWKRELTAKGKTTKVPYQVKNAQQKASSINPETWNTFDCAVKNSTVLDGIGFVTTKECGMILLDLDHCIVDGEPEVWAREILSIAKSYTELSPSGEGYHVFFKGKLPGPGKKVLDAEIYDSGRYFTVTGNLDPLYNFTFREVGDADVAKIYGLVLNRKPIAITQENKKPIVIKKDQILDRIFAAKNGAAIQSLYNGDTSQYGNDQSSADSALCFHLAFWTNGDSVEMDRLFRSSGLIRDKWDKRHSADGRTYGQMTIDNAISKCTKTVQQKIIRTEQVEHVVDGRRLEDTQCSEVSVTRAADYVDKVKGLYINGHVHGYSLPWESIKKHMQIVRGWIHVFTGFPGSGKTEFMLDIAVSLATKYNLKWAIFSPENYPAEDIISNLIEKKKKKPFFGQGRVSLEDVDDLSKKFINDNFYLLGVDNESVSLDGILAAAKSLDVDALMIDPYNTIESTRPVNMSMTEFVGNNLMRLQRYAKLNNKIVFISAHPTKAKKNDSGEYDVPELYDIADSAHWRNKADFGVTVYRNKTTEQTDIHIQKVRTKRYGEIGMVSLGFDKSCGSFRELNEKDVVQGESNNFFGGE